MKCCVLMGLLSFLLACSSALGVYSSDNVSVMAGGYGYTSVNGNNTYPIDINTWVDAGWPILVTGTLTEIKIRFFDGGANCDYAELKIFYGTYPDYSVRSTLNITSQLNAARTGGGAFLFDLTGLSIPVQAGDMIGFFMVGSPGSISYVTKTGTGTNLYSGFRNTSTMSTTYAGQSFFMDAYVSTNEFIIYDNNNRGAGLKPVNSPVFVPYFANQNQYIILQGVDNVDINENLTIGLRWTDANGNRNTLENIIIDMAAANQTIELSTYVKFKKIGMYNHKLDLHIWTNQTAGKLETLYIDRDTSLPLHKSLTMRSPQSITGSNRICELTLSQTSGSSAKIDRIIVCRKPVLAVGDSFVGGFSSTQLLTHVGARLDDVGVFTQQRYCINGGLSGNAMFQGTGTHIIDRWNSTGEMCAFRDVVVAFVNGPGLNDVASHVNNIDTQRENIAGLIGALSSMVREALSNENTYGGTNDVVLCQMIPYTNPTYANQYNAQTIITYNKLIDTLAFYSNLPVASMADFPIEYLYTDGTHPTTDGDLWIATRIAQAYENFPPAQQCERELYGDINRDCIVDFYDFSDMASNWLIDCQADPNNPQCESI